MNNNFKQIKKINSDARNKIHARGKKEQDDLNKQTKQQELF